MLRRLLESCYNSGPTTAQGSTTKRRQSEKWILERVGTSNGYEYKTAECRKTINAPGPRGRTFEGGAQTSVKGKPNQTYHYPTQVQQRH